MSAARPSFAAPSNAVRIWTAPRIDWAAPVRCPPPLRAGASTVMRALGHEPPFDRRKIFVAATRKAKQHEGVVRNGRQFCAPCQPLAERGDRMRRFEGRKDSLGQRQHADTVD